jgi:hypothetical protein
MQADREQVTTIRKEMGITHREFYGELPALLEGRPYQQGQDTITFQLDRRTVEIVLGPEGSRVLSPSIRLPVTLVTLHFFDLTDDAINDFLDHFNLRFMKGGG